MNTFTLISIGIIGIVLNMVILVRAAKREPEGGMGMGIFFVFGLVPWLVVVFWAIQKPVYWIVKKLESVRKG